MWFYPWRFGSRPSVAAGGSFRSFAGRWVGGFGSAGDAVVTPPTTPSSGLRHYPSGPERKRPRPFSRKVFDEWKAAREAKEDAERREAKRKRAKEALAKTARVAVPEATPELAPHPFALEAAATAQRLQALLAKPDEARQRAIAQALEDQDEEEAMMLLLMS